MGGPAGFLLLQYDFNIAWPQITLGQPNALPSVELEPNPTTFAVLEPEPGKM